MAPLVGRNDRSVQGQTARQHDRTAAPHESGDTNGRELDGWVVDG